MCACRLTGDLVTGQGTHSAREQQDIQHFAPKEAQGSWSSDYVIWYKKKSCRLYTNMATRCAPIQRRPICIQAFLCAIAGPAFFPSSFQFAAPPASARSAQPWPAFNRKRQRAEIRCTTKYMKLFDVSALWHETCATTLHKASESLTCFRGCRGYVRYLDNNRTEIWYVPVCHHVGRGRYWGRDRLTNKHHWPTLLSQLQFLLSTFLW